jgi:hypothetical protein
MPFYVGKGSGYRARVEQHRNPHWKAIAAKAGYEIEVAAQGLDEELAQLAESELIAKLRAIGVHLTNQTDGGGGTAGYRWDADMLEQRAAKQRGQKRPSANMKGIAKTDEHRAKLSVAHIGKTHTEETRAKMSAMRAGKPSSMLGKNHREESKRKTAEALRGAKNPFFGKTHSPEALDKIKAGNIGRKDSDETRRRKSEAKRGPKHFMFGKTVSAERKAKQIAALKARPRVTCPHCARTMDDSNAKRWHFDNCKGRM